MDSSYNANLQPVGQAAAVYVQMHQSMLPRSCGSATRVALHG